MKVTLYVPFANGDPEKGFKYEGEELTAKKYVKMEEEEYYTHKQGVDHMVVTSLGENMAYNTYKKRKIKVKNQSYSFHKVEANIRNSDNTEITVTQLDRLWGNKEQFGLFVYLNIDEQGFMRKPDLEIDLKMWIKDSQKIFNISELSDVEKVYHLPKKDFKIDFNNGENHAVLKNCKFAKLLSSVRKANGEAMITSFAIIVEKIIFIKS